MASTKIRGITIELGADTSGITSALKGVNSSLRSTQSELNDINRLLKFDPSNTELLSQKQSALQKALDATKQKLAVLRQAEEDLSKTMTDGGTEEQQRQLNALRREIASCEQNCDKYASQLDEVAEGEKEVGDAAAEADEGSSRFLDNLKANLTSSLITSGLSAIVDGLKQLASAAVDFVGEVISSYSEYEQLVGGVQKLFGESAATVQKYAENAYHTAGMSANDYLDTVTSFSASLIKSLGGDTEKAAQYADEAISDMSDNANTFGTDISSLQYAYQGFAKSNYTMLDNLKLGYSGSQEGMEALIADANALEEANGEMADLSIENYSDIVEAIHLVQEEMGIAGTTEREAAGTIEGSINSTKAAWENFVTGLGNSQADLKTLTSNLIQSAANVANNVIPIIKNIISAVPTAISGIMEAIQNNNILPTVLDAAKEIVSGVIGVLPGLLEQVITAVVELLPGLLEGLMAALPDIIECLLDMVVLIVDNADAILAPVFDALPDLIVDLVDALIQLIPDLVAGLVDLVVALVGHLDEIIAALIDAAPTIIGDLIQALIDCIPQLVQGAINLVAQFLTHLPEIILGILQAIPGIIAQIIEAFSTLPGKMLELVKWVWETVSGFFGTILSGVANLFSQIWNAISSWFSSLYSAISGWVNDNILVPIQNLFSNAWQIGQSLVTGIWNGISGAAGWLWNQITSWASSIWDGICSFFGIHSPSRKMAWVGQMLSEGLAGGIETYGKEAIRAAANVADEIVGSMSALSGGYSATISGAVLGSGNPQVVTNTASQVTSIGQNNQLVVEIVSLLNQYLPDCANASIYLDGDTLVGGTANKMNNALGKLSRKQNRGM